MGFWSQRDLKKDVKKKKSFKKAKGKPATWIVVEVSANPSIRGASVTGIVVAKLSDRVECLKSKERGQTIFYKEPVAAEDLEEILVQCLIGVELFCANNAVLLQRETTRNAHNDLGNRLADLCGNQVDELATDRTSRNRHRKRVYVAASGGLVRIVHFGHARICPRWWQSCAK